MALAEGEEDDPLISAVAQQAAIDAVNAASWKPLGFSKAGYDQEH